MTPLPFFMIEAKEVKVLEVIMRLYLGGLCVACFLLQIQIIKLKNLVDELASK